MVTGRAQSRARARPHPAAHRPSVCRTGRALAVVFVLLGILGFVPGVTIGYDTLRLAGPLSRALLFGAFQVSVLLNLVHLGFGLVGLALSGTVPGAVRYLAGGGALLLLLAGYGLTVGHGTGAANVLPGNPADAWLHLGFGLTMVTLGLFCAARRRSA
ncbi:DUF4383 domain-containing protein [Micromonospora zhanjiangensis]|uniref:DUF4383 domain-containing protein n=1 Tax=Micromonospora zhanjiangensis TaxID=1522057 RepID=A0ABV8KSZ5_9ACTN